MRRRRGTRAPCHRIGPNVTPTAPYALYASRGGGPGGLTIIAILDLLGGAAQCMVAAGPMHGIQLPATDATTSKTSTSKCMALYRVGQVECTRSQHARMQNSDLISDSELNRNFLHDAFRKKFSCMRSGGSQCIPLH